MKKCVYALVLGLLAFCAPLAPRAFGQIQSTTSCQAGHGYWDVLSVMMMDPGLASNYHMEGLTSNGSPSAYIYTMWDQAGSKVYYTKNPQGNPWDINLYDSNYIYQWVTELGTYKGVNHWNDPSSCKKFNNGSQNGTRRQVDALGCAVCFPWRRQQLILEFSANLPAQQYQLLHLPRQRNSNSGPESKLCQADLATHTNDRHNGSPRQSLEAVLHYDPAPAIHLQLQ